MRATLTTREQCPIAELVSLTTRSPGPGSSTGEPGSETLAFTRAAAQGPARGAGESSPQEAEPDPHPGLQPHL